MRESTSPTFALAVVGVAVALEIVAIVGFFFVRQSIVLAILACALLALTTGFVVYRGLDAVWRRPHDS